MTFFLSLGMALICKRATRGGFVCVNDEAVFCLQAKKPLHSGSYEHRVPKIKTFFFSVPGMFV